MRVIAGRFRGRRLQAPRSPGVRPSGDRLKESLFAILGNRIEGARVLDLYAGTGALGIEALSRGAEEVVFVDRDRQALRLLEANLTRCGIVPARRSRPAGGESRGTCDIIRGEARPALARLAADGRAFDVIFIDPPYASNEADMALDGIAAGRLLAPRGWVVVEHFSRRAPAPRSGALTRFREVPIGQNRLAFYAATAETAAPPAGER